LRPYGASMADLYLWAKAIHILAVLSWMAGLFYLPRLFVYHAEQAAVKELPPVFEVMERRLLKAIMRPAGLVTLISGLVVIWQGGFYGPMPWWLHFKLALVAGMLGFHGALEVHAVRFREGREGRSGRYFRIINEIPTLLVIGIVLLVVIKPF
jgi:putative membrane protein